MDLKFIFKETLLSLRMNPMRSSLSILGVVIGIASVVAMLAIGAGAQNEITKMINALGANNLHLSSVEMPDVKWNEVLDASLGVSDKDAALIDEMLRGATPPIVTLMSKMTKMDIAYASFTLPLGDYRFAAVDTVLQQVLPVPLLAGNFFSPFHWQLSLPVVIIPESFAAILCPQKFEQCLGKEVHFNQIWFTIIGVHGMGNQTQQAKKSNDKITVTPQSDSSASLQTSVKDLNSPLNGNDVLLPFTTFTNRVSQPFLVKPLSRIIIKVSDGDPVDAKQKIEPALRLLHRKKNVFQLEAASEIISQRKQTNKIFSLFLFSIASISLLVGAIGIANVMLATLAEKIKEVGLRRALGAKKRYILFQFLFESICICLLGGVLGLLVGLGFALILQWILKWNLVFSMLNWLIALLVSFVVGILSGLYPARKAAQISPIEAIQGR